MITKMKQQKQIKLTLGTLMVLLILAIRSPYAIFLNPLVLIDMGYNNFLLWQFQKQLFNYPLPENTKILTQKSEIGLLQGNGNHCDFEARLTIQSSNSTKAIIEHYRKLKISSAFGDGINLYQTIEEIEPEIISITIGDSHSDPSMDFRCY